MRLLAISGSLREQSSNTAILQAARRLAPEGVDVVHYPGMGDLPHFNPDLDADGATPAAVLALREEIGRCDGILISSPEYAHGVPGSLKNLLDWLVGALEFPDKPVAMINISPRATHAQASLHETLKTMSARLVEEAFLTVPLLGRRLDADGIAADRELGAAVSDALTAFVRAIDGHRDTATAGR